MVARNFISFMYTFQGQAILVNEIFGDQVKIFVWGRSVLAAKNHFTRRSVILVGSKKAEKKTQSNSNGNSRNLVDLLDLI